MKFYKKLKPFISLVCAIALVLSNIIVPVDAADTNRVTASTSSTVTQGYYSTCYVDIDSTEGLAALDVTVHFDPARVKITNVYNGVNCILYDHVTNADNIQFSYIMDGKGAAEKTRLFYFEYQVLSDAEPGSAYFDITIGEAFDSALNELDISGSRCGFTIQEAVTNKTCTLYGSGTVYTAVEQEFTVDYQFSTYQIASGTAVISYDPELFQVVKVTERELLMDKAVDINTALSGAVYISFVGTEYFQNSNFVSVTFKTLKNVTETSVIEARITELLDKELNSISCSGCTTTVNVAHDPSYVGDAPEMRLDGSFSYEDMQITLKVTLEAGSRLGAGDFVISFDPSLVAYNSCDKGFQPTFFNINDKNTDAGELKFHIISMTDILTEELVLTVTFDVNHPFSQATADFTLDGSDLTDSLTESIMLKFVDDSVWLEYLIVFCDADGNILQSGKYHYGDTVEEPEPPTKATDKIGVYTFAGWDTEVTACTADMTYTATYTVEYTDYTVKFLDEDGTLLSEKTYHWGDKVVEPDAPTKAADNTYTYSFAGWDEEVVACAGNATYKATYAPQYIDYTVTFLNEDGTLLQSGKYHYGDAVTAPQAPTKATDVIGVYTFAGWDQNVTACNGNTTYTATYTVEYTDYTVTFVNADGTILSERTYHWGDNVAEPDAPTKAADNTYTYTFAGWDKEVVACAGNATYKATYTSHYIDYTVKFVDEDGRVISEKTYHYGDKIVVPETPAKAADDTYTYSFAGWDKEVVACAGNATYKATYTSEYIDYTVIFVNEDGTEISKQTYHFGDKVIEPSVAPTKAADNTYTYTFAGWDKEVVACAGNATYKATYTSHYIDYTVKFLDEDGTVLSEKTYHYGEYVEEPESPTKAADNTYTYTFAGWDEEVVACAGNATYKATYTYHYIDYTVTFVNAYGTILSERTYHWGDNVAEPDAPAKAADNTYTYTFAGWDEEVVACAGNATYKATYTSEYIDYTVTFWNADETVLSQKTYHWGEQVIPPEDPTMAADDTFTYTFAGWNEEITACYGDWNYRATYTSEYIDYTVTFVDEDGTVLSKVTCHFGEQPTWPETPTKAADNTYTYTFAGWDKPVVNCVGNATYTATYAAEYIDYTVTFVDESGDIVSSSIYHYGDKVTVPEAPTKAADNTYTYTFAGWDMPVVDCKGDATYKATYTARYIEYTVKFLDEDGSILSEMTRHYGEQTTWPETPTKAADNTYIYTFAGWELVGAYIGNATYKATYTSHYIDYTVKFLDEDGTVLSEKTYHYGEYVEEPESPTKVADNTYTYTFAGWDKEVVNCAGNATYKATYTSHYIDYTVKFLDEDGTVLSEKTYHYGEYVEEPEIPTKAADNTYTYTFAGWDKEVVACAGNATYKATYTSHYIDYTVKFLDEDGTVLSEKTYHYGETVEEPESPTKAADNTYTYTFAGWNEEVTACYGDWTYRATYHAEYILYTVVFQNWNGDNISTEFCHYGSEITIPDAPTRPSDGAYTYTFAGWDKEVVPCAGNATYKATYTAKSKEPIRPDAIEGEYAEEINLWLKIFVPDSFKGNEDTYLVMTKQGGYGVETVTVKGSELGDPDGKGRYLLKMGIASGEMTSAVTYEFYDANGNKMDIITSSGNNMGNTATFSLLNYARSMLRTGTDAQKKMVAAMLTYGGYAQKYFGVDAENPAYNLLTELGMAVPSLDGVTADLITDRTIVADGGNGIKATGMQAFLDSAIYLRVYFNLAEGADIEDYKFVLTYADPEGNTHTKEVEPGYEAGRNRYYVDIEDIPAAYLDYMYNITVTNTKTNATYSVTTSVIVWVKNSLNSSSNEDQKNLLKAIYLYNQAANELFGK